MVNGECLGDLGAPHVKGSVSLMMNEGTRIGTICEERDAFPLTGAPDPAGATGRRGAPRPAPHLTHRPRPESRPAPRRHRGVALACAALALLGLLAHPSPAAAQAVTTFISNTGQTTTFTSDLVQAVAFTTGTSTYELSSVGIYLGSQTGDITRSVEIYGDSGGNPGTNPVAFLTNPESFADNAVHTFTPSIPITLSASTTYWVVTRNLAAADGQGFRVGLTNKTLDTGTAVGWSLGDALSKDDIDDDLWTASNRPLLFEIRGTGGTTATGRPTITGTAQVGQTLTAVTTAIMDGDGLSNVNYMYKWTRGATEIDGATASTYTLVAKDGGTRIKVTVSFTDDAGYREALTSVTTATVEAAPNTPATGAPTITGTAQVGQTLTAGTTGIMDADGLTSVSYAYQWIRVATDNTETNISQATASTYTLVAADLGTTIKVKVSFTDDASNPERLTSTATAVVAAPNTLPLASDGTVTTNEDTARTFAAADFNFMDTDTGDTLSNVRIVTLPASGTGTLALSDTPVTANQVVPATNIGTLTYTPPANANGAGYASFTFKVSDGTAESAAAYTMTITVTAVNDAPTVATAMTDQPNTFATVGTAFSYAFPDTTFADADGDTLTYMATKTDGATLPTWLGFAADTRTFSGTPQTADVGTVSVKVTASDGTGGSVSDEFDITVSAAANTPATGAPTITGTAQVGQILTADTTDIVDEDGLDQRPLHVPVDPGGHQQRRDGHLRGDDEHLHAGDGGPGHDDQGEGELHRRCRLRREADQRGDDARRGGGQHFATGAPTITGTVQVGQILTADTTDIKDTDGLTSVSYTYQWIRVDTGDETDIGAMTSTYTLVEADEGMTIKVTVSFTDDAGNAETLTSAATATVTTADSTPATGAPTITGTAQVGEILTAETAAIMDTDGLTSVTYTYQWIRVDTGDETDIGAMTSTYTLVEADEGMTIKVTVSFTDDAGNAETLTSAATATVTAADSTPATGAPTITGTAQVGEILTAETAAIMDTDGLTSVTYTYQWIRVDTGDETDIGAMTSTYTLVEADEGMTIKVTVSFTDDAGNAETLTSAATATVTTADSTPATGAPTITGTAQVGEILTAETAAIMDTDGLTSVTYTYQWIRVDTGDETDIGAMTSTYTLVEADEGMTIKVTVSFTDDAGNAETLTSAATATVTTADSTPATGAPTITGTAQVGADTDGGDRRHHGYRRAD